MRTAGPLGTSFSTLAGVPAFSPRLSSALWTTLGFASIVTTVSWAFLPRGKG
jgi:hypothetical protein